MNVENLSETQKALYEHLSENADMTWMNSSVDAHDMLCALQVLCGRWLIQHTEELIYGGDEDE